MLKHNNFFFYFCYFFPPANFNVPIWFFGDADDVGELFVCRIWMKTKKTFFSSIFRNETKQKIRYIRNYETVQKLCCQIKAKISKPTVSHRSWCIQYIFVSLFVLFYGRIFSTFFPFFFNTRKERMKENKFTAIIIVASI